MKFSKLYNLENYHIFEILQFGKSSNFQNFTIWKIMKFLKLYNLENYQNFTIEGLRAITTRDARSIVRLFFSQIR